MARLRASVGGTLCGMELIHVPLDRCPSCGEDAIERHIVDAPALFRHGGYGATVRSIELRCPLCLWDLVHTVREIRPLLESSALVAS